jgi:heterodisulfide reductase subunit A2
MSSDAQPTTSDKVGVYVCYCGGNISDHVDVEAVAERLKSMDGVAVARTDMFMCSDPGQEKIAEDIKSGKVDRVVVASCAPSLHETTFRGAIGRAGLSPYLYEHANIREQVSWVHHGPDATEKAAGLVRAAVGKARHLKPLEPIRVDAKGHATVIGGGMAGMRAALDLAGRGLSVMLIEKTPFLGGQAANLDRLAPTGEPAGEVIRELAAAVTAHPKIQRRTCTEVTGVTGYVGNFMVTARRRPSEDGGLKAADSRWLGRYRPFVGVQPDPLPQKEETFQQETGAIVFATGFTPYIPRTGEYGFGDFPEVIALADLIRAMATSYQEGSQLRVNGRTIRRMGMVHCVGSRQIPGIDPEDEDGHLNEYCSRVCCTSLLNAANAMRERFPETRVFDFYRDIRTYGRGHEAVYDRASDNGVTFFRFEPDSPPRVSRSEAAGFPLNVTVTDVLTFGEEVSVDLDLLVLAVGMTPTDITDLVELLKLSRGPDKFLLEVHPKLRPVELANAGVFLAGTCQTPMDIGESCAAAQGAAAKVAALLGKGYVELDPFVAEVDPARCKGHGRCAAECPEGAISVGSADGSDDAAQQATINPALCTGCGMCVPVCPENAVEINGWTLQQYEAMVDAILEPEGEAA